MKNTKNASVINTAKTKVSKTLQKIDTAKAISAVRAEKETKYIYPEDITSKDDKKKFRRKIRTTEFNYQKQMKSLKKSNKVEDKKELEKLTKDYTKFKKANYAVV